MPAFHDNKLKVVSLDSSGDESNYLPSPRKSAKASKAPSRPKTKAKAKTKPTPSTPDNKMGSVCSSLGRKRKRAPGRVGHRFEDYQSYSNRPDSGIEGYPLESNGSQSNGAQSNGAQSNSGQSGDSITLNVPDMYSQVLVANSDASTYVDGSLNTSHGSFFDDIAEWGNSDTGVQYLGDQNRRHVGGYDVDLRVPVGYPNSPRLNAFAAQENREALGHLPGNPYESSDNLNPGDPNYAPATAINFSRNNLTAYLPQPVDSRVDQPAIYRVELPANYELDHFAGYKVGQSAGYKVDHGNVARIKEESDGDAPLRGISKYHSDSEEESDYEMRASKVPKINKDGAPRKPRQPRPKLLKWTDNDWKNVALGIVWACGEVGLPIPFDQAAQVVATSCTAGALQQALLKLRDKQLAEGFQIPLLKMAWTRKNKRSNSSPFNADVKTEQETKSGKTMIPKKTPTRQEGNQVLMVVLKRSYKEDDRAHLPKPYFFIVRGRHRGPGPRCPRTVIAATGSPLHTTDDNVHENVGAQLMHLSPVQVHDGSDNNVVAVNGALNMGSAPQGSAIGTVLPQTGLGHQGLPPPRAGFVTPPRPIIATTPEAPRRVRQILRPDVEAIPFALAGETHGGWMQAQLSLTTSPSYDNFDTLGNGPFILSDSSSLLGVSSSSASANGLPLNSAADGDAGFDSSLPENNSGASQTPLFSFNDFGGPLITSSDFDAGAGESANQLDWSQGIKRDYDDFEDDILNNFGVGPASSPNDFLNINGSLPQTPPRSAAAEGELARRMASSNREDGAFNPQGHTGYTRYFEEDLHRTDLWNQVEKSECDDVFGLTN